MNCRNALRSHLSAPAMILRTKASSRLMVRLPFGVLTSRTLASSFRKSVTRLDSGFLGRPEGFPDCPFGNRVSRFCSDGGPASGLVGRSGSSGRTVTLLMRKTFLLEFNSEVLARTRARLNHDN